MTDTEFENTLPAHIDLHNRINVYAGWGDLPILSNLGRCEFEFNDVKWHSVEQAYLYYKAIYHKSKRTAKHILQTEDPFECKSISNNIIKQSDALHQAWERKAMGIMKTLIRASLSNHHKRATLLRTQNALLTHLPETSRWRHDFPLLLMQLRKEIQK